MLLNLEKKANDKILKLESQKQIVIKNLTKGLDSQMEIEDLIDIHDEIRHSKINIRINKILSLIFILLISINPVFVVAALYSIIAIFIERSNISENKKIIKRSSYRHCTKKGLEAKLRVAEKQNVEMRNTISEQRNQIKKYAKIIDEINYVKELEKNINNENFEKLKELYTEIPVLAFNSNSEYKNYLSYNDEKFKDDIISSKILSKRKI